MVAILQQYSLSEVIMFLILLAAATKSFINFYDWCMERLRKVLNTNHNKLTQKEQLQRRLQHGSQIMNNLQNNQKQTDKILKDLSAKIDMLVDSDKDAIKSYITRQHHYFCYQKGQIDDFSLDCCEKRYQHYSDEGGNSFIEGFMNELRALPKVSAKN